MRTQAGAIDGANLRGELPELVVVGGLKPGLHAALHRGSSAPPVLMGRDPAGGLVIDWDLMVSNRHAEVRALATGYQIVDLYSRNGTFVNGARLRPGTPAALRSGDIVQLGRTSLVFRD